MIPETSSLDHIALLRSLRSVLEKLNVEHQIVVPGEDSLSPNVDGDDNGAERIAETNTSNETYLELDDTENSAALEEPPRSHSDREDGAEYETESGADTDTSSETNSELDDEGSEYTEEYNTEHHVVVLEESLLFQCGREDDAAYETEIWKRGAGAGI